MDVRSRVSLGVLSVAFIVLIAACSSQAPADKAAAAPAATPPVDVRKHMDEHFAKVTEVQAAVVRGDVVGAREGARWIAEHQETAGLPASGQPSLEEMKKAAKAVVEATDIKAAAQGSADMAVACGSCHAASRSKPAFLATPPPTPKNETAARMLAHQRAVDQMYLGLVGPSEESWAAGARALKEAPLMAGSMPKPAKAAKEAVKAEADTRAMAEKAIVTTDVRARGAIYAQLVGDCASCHALYGRVLGEGLPK